MVACGSAMRSGVVDRDGKVDQGFEERIVPLESCKSGEIRIEGLLLPHQCITVWVGVFHIPIHYVKF